MEKLVGFEKFVIILENIKYLRTWPTLEWLLWLSVATYLSLSPENNTTIFSANRRNDAGETNKFIILLKNSSLGYRTTENSQHASASLI